MLPKLISWPIPIHSYGLMIAIAFLVAVPLMKRDAKKAGIDPNVMHDMSFWGLLLGILGTRILHIVMFPSHYSWGDPVGWIALWNGGLVFQGGPPVVIIFCFFYLKKKGQPTWKTGDVIFPYLALGHAFGRMGCFLNGCCHGAPTDVPWGTSFPKGSPAQLMFEELTQKNGWSCAVHPTQLYSVIALVSLCLFLLFLRNKWHPFDGFTMPVYFCLYSMYRFSVEFLRGDGEVRAWNHLSQQQLICILFFVIGLIMFFIMRSMLRGHAIEEVSEDC